MKVSDLKKVCDEFYIEECERAFQESPVLASFPSAYDDYDVVKVKAEVFSNKAYIVVQVVAPAKE